MTTIDNLYLQLDAEKQSANRYHRLAGQTRNDPMLHETLRNLHDKSLENAELLEKTIQHLLEKEVW